MLDIKRIFDKYHVQWRDRGKNVSHDNLVISCVYCNKTHNYDPGEHLSVNYNTGEFFCYRNSHHKGFISKLFHDLKIPEHEYSDIKIKKVERAEDKTDRNYAVMSYFQSADQSEEATAYLRSRKFTNPHAVCKKFKLLVDKEGKWAGRLIIPLTIGWTGRSMREHIEPRYLAFTDRSGFFLYRQNSTTCAILEGAIDGMRVASVSTQFDVIGKCRNGISPAILSYLREAGYMTIINVPDKDVDFTLYFDEQKLLRSYCTTAKVERWSLPKKDFGEMTEQEARAFLLMGGQYGKTLSNSRMARLSIPKMG